MRQVQQLIQEKDQVMKEKDQVVREKDQVVREKDHIIVQLMCLVVLRRRHATAIDKQNYKYVSLFAVLHSWIN